MEINRRAILAETLRNNGIAPGCYILNVKKQSFDIFATNRFDYFASCKITVDKNYNVSSDNYSLESLFDIIMTKDVEFIKTKPDPVRYFYFDKKLQLKVKSDADDETDKCNKENHNYFPVSDYDDDALDHALWHHICDMRLNLLATFHPGIND